MATLLFTTMLDLLCAILREETYHWPDIDEAGAMRLYDLAREHGVHLLVAERAWQRGAMNDCPPALRARFVTALRSQLTAEEISRQELRNVLDTLNDAGIAPLLFKGTALAFTHYQDPCLRPRFDTDVLIDASEIQSTGATLGRLGYRRPPFTSGDLVMYQAPYSRTDRRGVRHTLDVHWRISNPQVFAGMLTVEELRTWATAIPPLGNWAWAVGPAHALALACIHRVAHHSDEERLIWIYDIHLLAEQFAAAECEQFINLVDAKHLTAVCAGGLELAQRKFRGLASASLLARLTPQLATTRDRSEIYASGNMRKVDVLLSDLKALEGWRSKVRLLREHVLPPASYMQEAYGISNTALLPFFYVWRVIRGARAWWRK